ncbi:MAG: hypothetical protein ABL927_05155 [Bdellovibrionales bacterium]
MRASRVSFLQVAIIVATYTTIVACSNSTETRYPAKVTPQGKLVMNAYPHPKKWALPTNHGVEFAKSENKEACFVCHNKNMTVAQETKDGPPRCQSCHEAFPHPENWTTDQTKPGFHNVLAKSYAGKCLNCHRNYVENMPTFGSNGGCKMCHSNMPYVVVGECKNKDGQCDVKVEAKWFYINNEAANSAKTEGAVAPASGVPSTQPPGVYNPPKADPSSTPTGSSTNSSLTGSDEKTFDLDKFFKNRGFGPKF